MPRVKTVDIETAVNQILKEYNMEVTEEMQAAVKEAAKVGVKKVKENSNIFNGKKYKSGWTSRVETGRLSAQGVIYNGKQPGLPHLLEFGHAVRRGGRTIGEAGAHEHIAPVENELERVFMSELEKHL